MFSANAILEYYAEFNRQQEACRQLAMQQGDLMGLANSGGFLGGYVNTQRQTAIPEKRKPDNIIDELKEEVEEWLKDTI